MAGAKQPSAKRSNNRLGRLYLVTPPLHSLRISEVFRTLGTSPAGLAPEEAQTRLSLHGPNVLREPSIAPSLRRLIGHLMQPMALLLLTAGLLAALGGRHTLGLVIWLIVLVNAGFSFWREHRAEQAVTALGRLLPSYARVIRGNVEAQILTSQVVPGDVLVLAEGDNIPADARVVEEYGLRVNHATLTGESMPARRSAEASLREGLTEVEQPNLVFAGTSVVLGTGRAVVYATGMLTQFGRIANLTQTVREEPSLIQQQLRRTAKIISLFAIGIGAVVFLVGALDVGFPADEAFVLAVGIIVAAIPEGLPATVTLSLAIAVQRLAQRGVLVKRLSTIETLGTTSIICADKSGTLTQNQMTVREVWVAGQRLRVSGLGYEPKGEFAPSPRGTPLERDFNTLLEAALLCNNSRLIPPSAERPQWASLGDQTEAALRVLALKGGLNEEALNAIFPRIHELPFDARRKRMSTLHRDAMRGCQTAIVKGAPREILQLCTHVWMRGEARKLDNATRAAILAAHDDYARNAMRVIALARRELPPRSGAYSTAVIEQGLTFLGLTAMTDPPRPEVAEAMKTLREAGVRTVMVTGDYGLTAESLARRIGMLTRPNPRLLTGADIDGMSDAELQSILDEEIIFARMAPDHKLRLVAALQARGHVVAVTGDGVNDAPALRKADVGVAMGVTGTDVAKQAADVILTGDNFAAITHAIAEGRAIYDNLRKFMTYIFASNVPEIVPFILMALLNIPLALTVAHVLAIDLGTDLLPALALGTELPEHNVMRRPPRRRTQALFDAGLVLRALWLGGLETALCFAGFFFVYTRFGYTDFLNLPRADLLPFADRLAAREGIVYILATTVFHAGVVVAQMGNAFACRTEKDRVRPLGLFSNRFLLRGIAVEGLLILGLIYAPPLAMIFEHAPLPPVFWLGLMLYAPLLYGLDRTRKGLVRLMERVRAQRRPGVVTL